MAICTPVDQPLAFELSKRLVAANPASLSSGQDDNRRLHVKRSLHAAITRTIASACSKR